jgi:type I restriction enzyme S subunit
MRLKVKGEILPAYLWNAINCNEYHRVFVNLAKPGTQIYINTGDVLNFKITIPTDLKEQSAIVEIISSLANELTALDRKLSKLKLLKQGMMQELLTGRIRLV